MDIRRIKAIEAENKRQILKTCPSATERSGIYIMKREEDGFKYAYIGQAKHVLTRLAQHLSGHQRIDLSIKKHGLWSKDNETGWKIGVLDVPIEKLDSAEKSCIMQYANAGYQMRNVTSGGQGKGKSNINDSRPAKGYYDGIDQGKRSASRMVRDWFTKHLVVSTKNSPPTKNQQKALDKFYDFISIDKRE